MTCLVYFKYVVTLFRSRHSLYLFNVYFISFKRLQAWARMFTSFYFISDLSSREPYRATYPWENTWSLFPRPPRGMLRRGAICGRMHLRPCTGVKEPGWPRESLGVRKHTDNTHWHTVLRSRRWADCNNECSEESKWWAHTQPRKMWKQQQHNNNNNNLIILSQTKRKFLLIHSTYNVPITQVKTLKRDIICIYNDN